MDWWLNIPAAPVALPLVHDRTEPWDVGESAAYVGEVVRG